MTLVNCEVLEESFDGPAYATKFSELSVLMLCLDGHRFSSRTLSKFQFTGAPRSELFGWLDAPACAPPFARNARDALTKLCFMTVTSTNAHLPSVAKSPLVVTRPKSKMVRVMSEPRPVLSGQVTRTCAS